MLEHRYSIGEAIILDISLLLFFLECGGWTPLCFSGLLGSQKESPATPFYRSAAFVLGTFRAHFSLWAILAAPLIAATNKEVERYIYR